MRQVTRKRLTLAAATGVIAMTGGYAHADSGANGTASDSPGVLSGNSVQVPVDVPVNVCGNTVNVVGVLNPAADNDCGNVSEDNGDNGNDQASGGGSEAGGHASDSPGIGSGNNIQVPVDVPVNVCGNNVTVGGLGNAAADNECGNSSDGNEAAPPGGNTPSDPAHPDEPQAPVGDPGASDPNQPETHTVTAPQGAEQLAATGSSLPVGMVLPVGAGALLAGAVLYRKARSAA
ncbi:chaplin [Streptomyces himalayensis]|uniref:Chaplin n=1 Tax=Streptomyces himalayensis subsp. himalayensis TaxID=2756131 RepID=A0A7W0DJW3_9ACTN|nr:chaplin [Streptomyces himalayensis]MBA2946456.1 chaplin [Streptomyces himalayensis subsp. himalayensis]